MCKVNAGRLLRSSAVSLFDSIFLKSVLILLILAGLIFFRPAESAYAVDGFNCQDQPNPVRNCGFESGNLSGWITQDLSNPFWPLSVVTAGFTTGFGFFLTDPPQGTHAAFTGFDGNGPGTISLAQDIILSSGATTLTFDYQCAWDLVSFGATLDRTFEVNMEPSGGGAPLQTDTILTAVAGTTAIPDSGGDQTASVDVSAFAGQAVRISFDWFVPETFTGPAQCQLDNVFIDGGRVNTVPTLSEWGTILTAGILGFMALITLKRRRALRS